MGSKILITADIVPTERNINKFNNADLDYLVGDKLKKRFQDAIFIAMNLEVPLVDTESPIRKCGPCLIAPSSTIKGLKAINPHFFTLANNHILDQGISGLKSTMKVLSDNSIDFSGVGANLSEARNAYIRKINGKSLGIYCCVEHEYSIATENSPGANPYDPLVVFDDVQNLRHNCDYIIVLYHGGKEHYRYPSPILQKIFHKFVNVGADLVIAQHTHCIGCQEIYKDGTLIYGQGNFLFDHSDSDYWKTSLIVEVDIDSKKVRYIPIIKEEDRVREAEKDEWNQILDNFYTRSKEILQVGFIDRKYTEFADEMETEYLTRFSGGFGKNIIFRTINKLTAYRFIKQFYSDKYKVIIENVLDCEAHRELATMALRGKLNEHCIRCD